MNILVFVPEHSRAHHQNTEGAGHSLLVKAYDSHTQERVRAQGTT